MAGITFNDTVVIGQAHRSATEPRISLLFHELVHVVQYSLVGVDGFIARYVRGWAANGFHYHGIPLERDAYALQSRFEAGDAFSVASEVSRQLERS